MLLAWLVGQMPTVGDVSNHFNPPHPQTFGRPHNQQTETQNKQSQSPTNPTNNQQSRQTQIRKQQILFAYLRYF